MKQYPLDKQGFLLDFSAWDRDFAANQALLLPNKIILSDKHWRSIEELQKFYHNYARHPSMRVLIKLLSAENIVQNTLELHKLFGVDAVLKTMSLLAGLPKPPHCI